MMERVKYSKLKGFLVEKNIKQKDVAELLNMTISTFNKKLNGTGADFTMQEARLICMKYNVKAEIFFN